MSSLQKIELSFNLVGPITYEWSDKSEVRFVWILWNEFDKIPLHWIQLECPRLVYCRQPLDGQKFIPSVVLPIIWSWRWSNGINLVQLTRWQNLNTNVRNISSNGLQYATFSTKQGFQLTVDQWTVK